MGERTPPWRLVDDSGAVNLAAVREMERAAGDMEVLLRTMQWALDDGVWKCPVCGSWEERGHGTDCPLAALLKRLDEARRG